MERHALIVAGGSGTRFGKGKPKQFRELGGEPLLLHSLRTFRELLGEERVHLVLPREHFGEWEELCEKYGKLIPHEPIEGGSERFHSVRNGLAKLPLEADILVAVHDAARPFIRSEWVRQLFEEAEREGSAVPAVPLDESVRGQDESGRWRAMDRSRLRKVQTPQIFRLEKLKAAMEQSFQSVFTDEASVMEAFGERIQLCEGDPRNIKISYPLDLKIGEAILKAGE